LFCALLEERNYLWRVFLALKILVKLRECFLRGSTDADQRVVQVPLVTENRDPHFAVRTLGQLGPVLIVRRRNFLGGGRVRLDIPEILRVRLFEFVFERHLIVNGPPAVVREDFVQPVARFDKRVLQRNPGLGILGGVFTLDEAAPRIDERGHSHRAHLQRVGQLAGRYCFPIREDELCRWLFCHSLFHCPKCITRGLGLSHSSESFCRP
jgi:hypothetical protein